MLTLFFLVNLIASTALLSSLASVVKVKKQPYSQDLKLLQDPGQHKNQLSFIRSSTVCSKGSQSPEASSTTRVLSSTHCTDVRLYTLRIKIGTRTTNARELHSEWQILCSDKAGNQIDHLSLCRAHWSFLW